MLVNYDLSNMSIPFQPCSSMCISGQTGSGKTQFVYRLLTHLNDLYDGDPPKKILYCYGIHQPLFDEMEQRFSNLILHHGVPTNKAIEELTFDRQHALIVLDDLMHRVVRDPEMELLFTQGCYHRRLSVVFITQNLFLKGSKSRTIALNTYYLILMKNARDASQISMLGRQLYPGCSNLLVEAYKDATKLPFGYLVVDTSPRGDDEYRLRTIEQIYFRERTLPSTRAYKKKSSPLM